MSQTIYEKLARCCSDSEIKQMLKGTDHVVLPLEPTEEMLMSCIKSTLSGVIFARKADIRRDYKSMVSASTESDIKEPCNYLYDSSSRFSIKLCTVCENEWNTHDPKPKCPKEVGP